MERKFFPALVAVAAVLGILVWAALGRDHTKTVTKTKVVSKVVVKPVAAPPFHGALPSLVAFLRPKTGKQVACNAQFPARSACFQLGSTSWFIFFAAPESAAKS